MKNIILLISLMCTSILSFAEQTKDSVLADVVGTKKVSFDFEEL